MSNPLASDLPIAPPLIPESKNAEAAFLRVSPRIEALAETALAPLNVDLDRVARTAFELATSCVSNDVWPRLALYPPALFDAAKVVPELADLALAASWLATRGLAVRAGQSEAQLPQSLVQNALALRGRMFATCEYCLEDEVAVAELASIRAGSGYDDLKHDLRRLAILYRERKAELGGKRHDAADEGRALAFADEINLRQRTSSTAAQLQFERGLWTLLKAAGEATFEAASFATRETPHVRGRLKSIHSWRGVASGGKATVSPLDAQPGATPDATPDAPPEGDPTA